jgi:hypothetical protein
MQLQMHEGFSAHLQKHDGQLAEPARPVEFLEQSAHRNGGRGMTGADRSIRYSTIGAVAVSLVLELALTPGWPPSQPI